MTVVVPTLSSLVPSRWNNNVAVYTWAALATGDTGTPISGPGFADVSVQFGGTFGGATVTFEGSNDGTNYATLVDPFNVALSFAAAAGPIQVMPICLFIRPKITGGAGAAINIVAIMRNSSPN